MAHNVKFDANLLAEALFWEGFELTTSDDTVELSQIFYPTLERYNLGALAAELEIEVAPCSLRFSGCIWQQPSYC